MKEKEQNAQDDRSIMKKEIELLKDKLRASQQVIPLNANPLRK